MKRIDENTRSAVIKAYQSSDMTIGQIAKKYGIGTRVIYQWTTDKTVRRHHDKTRVNIRLTEPETETVIEALTAYNGNCPEIAETLKSKIEVKLTELKEIENANR